MKLQEIRSDQINLLNIFDLSRNRSRRDLDIKLADPVMRKDLLLIMRYFEQRRLDECSYNLWGGNLDAFDR